MTQPHDEHSSAAAAAAAAANSAASTVHAFEALSMKIDRGYDKIYDKLDTNADKLNLLNQTFAVHLESEKYDRQQLEKLHKAIYGNGDAGLVEKVNKLWGIDQLRIWGIRLLVGAAISIITLTVGYGFVHWFGWK